MNSNRLYTQAKFEKDKTLVDYIERYGINLENSDMHLDEKHDDIWVKILEHKSLRVGSDECGHPFEYAERCKPSRLTAAIRRQYYLATIHLKEVEEGLRKVIADVKPKSLTQVVVKQQELELGPFMSGKGAGHYEFELSSKKRKIKRGARFVDKSIDEVF
ncbi:hypothetical protein J4225_00640 [Candidatus Pacearchaeota archaeon]|nr:hypothetical protein [Candidatus Pacearchaeota archaeon]